MRVIKINSVNNNKRWHIKLPVDDCEMSFRIDTGADETIIALKQYNKILKHKYQAKTTSVSLNGPGTRNHKLDVYGKEKIPITFKDKTATIRAYIVDTPDNLLGKPALEKLNIVKWEDDAITIQRNINLISDNTNGSLKNQVKEKYRKLFDGVGNLINYEYKITLADDAVPFAISTPRRVPIPVMENVQSELNKMVNEGIIQQVNEPTEWCAPMVIASKKNGGIRVCADYTELNKFVRRELFQLPSVDETLSKLQEAKLFSKLDFSCGFWQLNLATE